MSKAKTPDQKDDAPAMPFNEALKRVWSAKPMPKVKPKPEPAKQDKSAPKAG
jgi:hypothetical protein